jgi:hypothetical protein
MNQHLNKLQQKTVKAIHSDSIVKKLLNKKIEVYQNSIPLYLIKGTDIITTYPNETNQLIEKLDEEINDRIADIINHYIDLFNGKILPNE